MPHVRTLLRTVALAVVLGAALPAGASAATGAIQGTVTANAGGAGIPQYAVELYSANRTKLDTVCTTNTGTYAFPGLATGAYYVSFSGDASCASTGFAPQWFDARLAGKNAEPVNVTDGAVRSGVDASLEPEGTVSGTVTAPGGLTGRAGVSVRVIDTDGVEASRACTAPDGTYTVRRLTPVPYVVQFVDDGSCGVPGGSPSRYYRAGTPTGAPAAGGASPVSTSYGLDEGGIDLELSAPERTLTVTITGSGVVSGAGGAVDCASTCATARPAGSSATLTATPAAGSTFTGWTGACAGTGTCQVTLDADRTVGATFVVTPGGGDDGGDDPGPGTPGTPGTPGGTVPGGGTPGGVLTPPAVVPPVVPGPGTTPTPTAPQPAPKATCRIAAPSKVRRGRFTVRLRCDRRAELVLTGSLRFRSGKRTTTVKLATTTTTATTKTVTLKVPAKAARALRSKVRVSATLRLKATTSAGSSTVAPAAKRLR